MGCVPMLEMENWLYQVNTPAHTHSINCSNCIKFAEVFLVGNKMYVAGEWWAAFGAHSCTTLWCMLAIIIPSIISMWKHNGFGARTVVFIKMYSLFLFYLYLAHLCWPFSRFSGIIILFCFSFSFIVPYRFTREINKHTKNTQCHFCERKKTLR